MAKINCWEFKKCSREPGGDNTSEFGICPATLCKDGDDINDGVKAGRVCWAIGGTLCGGKVQGSFADKQGSCMQCDFYSLVRNEEGNDFKIYLKK